MELYKRKHGGGGKENPPGMPKPPPRDHFAEAFLPQGGFGGQASYGRSGGGGGYRPGAAAGYQAVYGGNSGGYQPSHGAKGAFGGPYGGGGGAGFSQANYKR